MRQQKTNDIILQTATKLVSFIILLFSFYLFLSGHNAPGGGFVGGLITSSAIVLLLLAFDLKTVKSILPVNFIYVAGAGLLIAIATGAGSFLFGAPFLTHTFGHFHLPVLGNTELATATLFDLGVYLVVVGVTMTIIQTIGEEE
ncbi:MULTISPECIES: Na(+)/H(+) antiporter subunit B [Bacillus]|uniref:Na(+)/H(+) antiporter subunit B n=4 Tax=Bacillus amyloliquefaciens group TaxID=1938374 RepID=A0AAI8MZ76_9BACI|nr:MULTISPECIES: Na(+)/H(+) antiporter subunit B [Bacillus]AIW38616.1 monovalent cation/H+ antiporter subunit B [Bacillus subtilis]ARM28989.1 Na(+)/H(+) antiporter subunit B [Bacillus vallismortis]SLC19807.1 NADH:ubiquinone oxidoreductase subunit 5 (chain L)/multisubunit Na+/H+ antiporter, MnhA subunit [Mycobacteroides abscessus subsp. massiliense]AFJ63325.1 putative monovalent cation/H+ antiporter subunit B [Bacillus velezensis YAU B9601-Y2]AHZ17153.1 monovalent cation/H+ antiporter subunit B